MNLITVFVIKLIILLALLICLYIVIHIYLLYMVYNPNTNDFFPLKSPIIPILLLFN
jgi:hypothetical protein